MRSRSVLATALLACLGCFALCPAPRLAATSMAFSHYHCALCGEDYAGDATCPRCLYTPPGTEPVKKFTKAEAARVRAAIASYPQSLAPAVRARLERTALPDGDNEFAKDLAARCEAARRGEPLPTPGVPAVPAVRRPSSDDYARRSRRRLQEALPGLLERLRQGQPIPRTFEDGGSILVIAVREAAQGDAGAWELYMRSLLVAGEDDVKYHSFDDLLVTVAAAPALPWPEGVDFGKARIPLLIDSLRYVRDPGMPLPPTVREELAKTRDEGYRFSVAATACAIRRDRAAAPLLARQLSHREIGVSPTSMERFYTRAGVPADIVLLGPHAHCRPEAAYGDDWEADCYAAAVRAIQFRSLFAGRGPTNY